MVLRKREWRRHFRVKVKCMECGKKFSVTFAKEPQCPKCKSYDVEVD